LKQGKNLIGTDERGPTLKESTFEDGGGPTLVAFMNFGAELNDISVTSRES